MLAGQQTLSHLPHALTELATIFADAGQELSLVGGPVRDALLGLPIHDFDLTTSARPDLTHDLLERWSHSLWEMGRDFGTIGAARGSLKVEVTTYRQDSYTIGSRKPTVDFGDSLEGDLTRRDFTVNAMAVRLPELTLVDPCYGLDDLVAGVLRTPVSAQQSFDDDPLRIMRAARFASQLSFDVAPDVMDAMADMAERLQIVSAERIRAELERMMISPAPRRGIELLVYTGVADIVLPEISALEKTQDPQHRHKDVYAHTLQVLDHAIALEDPNDYDAELLGGPLAGPDLELRLAALFHDIGKPATRRFEPDGSVTFRGHDHVGASMTRKRMKALRFDKQTIAHVSRLVDLHLRAFGFSEQDWTDSAVRRFVRDAGDLLPRLVRLIRADITSQNKRRVAILHAANDELTRRIAELARQEEIDAIRPDLDGKEIMEILGLTPGPEVGAARSYMLQLRLDEGPLSHEEATARLLEWWNSRH
ncbi:MAG: CCA tRNA nucleotidyltransferase [Actinomycetaceae bacterium]|nr:CCA tRNA nucleotidyltransferase [Actinomycetaceae bacterium]MDY6082446.1 CCA tRNA nucleotidyltransferase [Actinomycetaceae bacterium]